MPRVSVIVPAYYSYDTLFGCLGALARQTYRDFELIVVNSSQEEETARIMQSHGPEARFVQSPVRLLPHAARNAGIALAQGEIFVFTDPDCRARPDWLEKLVASHDAGHGVVAGAMGMINPHGPACAVHMAKFSWLLEGLPPRPVHAACTANASYTREVFSRIGPFAGDVMIGDGLQSWRAAAIGHEPWFEPRAVVDHHHDPGIQKYINQFYERGQECGRVRIEFEHWGRIRSLIYAAACPALVLMTMAGIGFDAVRSGHGVMYLTWGSCAACMRFAWGVGEALARLKYALGIHSGSAK